MCSTTVIHALWKLRDFTATILLQKFRQITFFTKELFSNIDLTEKILHGREFTVWKLRKFTVTLIWQKFRESKVFTKENTKDLI